MNFAKFERMFGSRFRPLGEADGLPEWAAEIGRPEVDEGTMRTVLARLSDRHRRMTAELGREPDKPRLGEIMAMYGAVAKETAATAWRETADRLRCSHCDGSGWAMAVRHESGRYALPTGAVRALGGRWSIVAVPCHCPLGGSVPAPGGGTYPQQFRDRLRPYHCGAGGDLGAGARELWNLANEAEADALASRAGEVAA
jgi:hypothetical protein